MGIILLFFFLLRCQRCDSYCNSFVKSDFFFQVLQPQCKRFSIYLTSCYIHVGATNNLQVQTVLSVIYYFTNSSCNIADIIWIIIYVRKDKKLIHALKKNHPWVVISYFVVICIRLNYSLMHCFYRIFFKSFGVGIALAIIIDLY